jgi:hypothetical protein
MNGGGRRQVGIFYGQGLLIRVHSLCFLFICRRGVRRSWSARGGWTALSLHNRLFRPFLTFSHRKHLSFSAHFPHFRNKTFQTFQTFQSLLTGLAGMWENGGMKYRQARFGDHTGGTPTRTSGQAPAPLFGQHGDGAPWLQEACGNGGMRSRREGHEVGCQRTANEARFSETLAFCRMRPAGRAKEYFCETNPNSTGMKKNATCSYGLCCV